MHGDANSSRKENPQGSELAPTFNIVDSPANDHENDGSDVFPPEGPGHENSLDHALINHSSPGRVFLVPSRSIVLMPDIVDAQERCALGFDHHLATLTVSDFLSSQSSEPFRGLPPSSRVPPHQKMDEEGC